MSGGWYVKSDIGILGPITFDELSAFSTDGALPPETPIRQGVAGRWETLRNIVASSRNEETKDPSTAAAKILAHTGRPIGTGRVRQQHRTSNLLGGIVGHLVRAMSYAATGLLYPLYWVIQKLEPYKRQLMICLLLAITVGLPAYPWIAMWLIRSPREAYAELEQAWEQIQEQRKMTEAANADKSGHDDALTARLRDISQSVDRRRSLTGPQTLISTLFGHDKEMSLALADLQRLASVDLPAAMAAESKGSAARDRDIKQQFDSVHGHLTDRIRPYLPQPSANALRSRFQGAPKAAQGWPWVTLLIVVADFGLLLGVLRYWLRSRGRIRSANG